MTPTFLAVVLGVVEGLTEFIPVSSTGHLVLAGALLGFKGSGSTTFDIVIQLGAILAVVVLYAGRFGRVLSGLARREPDAIRFTRNIVLGLIPAVVIGAVAYHAIKAMLEVPVIVAVALIVGGIEQALTTYPRVHVASVPGNHSRTTFKSTAKLYSRLSYDTLIAHMVADRFRNEDRVTFQIGWAPDAIVPVLGRTLLLTHGDKMGTGGGQGFAGPLLPIVRGTKKVEAQQSRAGRRPDIIAHGHYHHSANPGPVFSNGAFPGYSEYGNGLRANLEPAQQWLFLVHERWGVRERCEIKLQDPSIPAAANLNVPAEMAYRRAA